MAIDFNPQLEQMAHESMLRCLDAQARALWPQEMPLFLDYDLPDAAHILDVGCGTGELSSRLAELFPGAGILGVDIIDEHLALARDRHAVFGERLVFENRDAFDLGLPDDRYDLVVCRHMLQTVPHPERVVSELLRVSKTGAALHLLLEDYGMIFSRPGRFDADEFWNDGAIAYGNDTGVDLRGGRRAYTMLRECGVRDIRINYLCADTLRVPRDTLAEIIIAWRDGFSEPIGRHSRFSEAEARERMDDIIDTINNPDGYFVWLVPVITAINPE